MKFSFTYGESDLHSNVVELQNIMDMIVDGFSSFWNLATWTSAKY